MSGEFDLEPGQPPLPALEEAPEPPPRDPIWGYSDLALVLAMVLPSGLLAWLLTMGLFAVLPWAPASTPARMLSAQFIFFGVLLAALWGLLRLRYRRTFREAMAWAPPEGAAWWTLSVGGFTLAVVVSAIGHFLGAPDTSTLPIAELLKDRVAVLIVAVAAVTIGPLFEELMFRGFVLPLFVRSMGVALGLTLTSLPFALLHGSQYSWSWQHMTLLFAVSMIFGWVRLRTGSTFATTLMHASYNLFPTSLLLASSYGRGTLG